MHKVSIKHVACFALRTKQAACFMDTLCTYQLFFHYRAPIIGREQHYQPFLHALEAGVVGHAGREAVATAAGMHIGMTDIGVEVVKNFYGVGSA